MIPTIDEIRLRLWVNYETERMVDEIISALWWRIYAPDIMYKYTLTGAY